MLVKAEIAGQIINFCDLKGSQYLVNNDLTQYTFWWLQRVSCGSTRLMCYHVAAQQLMSASYFLLLWTSPSIQDLVHYRG
jgi:hypothetical protein